MPRALFAVLVCCLLALAALPGGCMSNPPLAIELSPGTQVTTPSAVVILVDGMGREDYQRLLEAGRLPNIEKYLLRRGVSVEQAVASYPSITYANLVSLLTGVLPGHHGVIGNKWFDRDRLVYESYTHVKTFSRADTDYTHQTIYELLRDEFTASILTPVRRGATRSYDNVISYGAAWALDWQDTVNKLTTCRLTEIAELSNRAGRWPRLITAYYVTPDTVGHRFGASHPRYTEILLDVDRQVGNVCQGLERAGLLDKTYVTLISDHGFVDTPRHTDIVRYFSQELGVETRQTLFGRDDKLEERLAHFGPARAVIVTGGDRRCAIHLRAGEHWWQRPNAMEIDGFAARFARRGTTLPAPSRAGASTLSAEQGDPSNPVTMLPEVAMMPQGTTMPVLGAAMPEDRTLPGMLAALPAVDLVVVRLGPNTLRVQTAEGMGIIERIIRDGRKLYRYRVFRGKDPLGYDKPPVPWKGSEFHPAEAWFEQTLGTPRPDAVVQLAEMNDSPRNGDIVLFARDGWDFGTKNRGGHGGVTRKELLVPWLVAGPGLPAGGHVSAARTVDLTPTLLDLLGRAELIPCEADGRSIAGQLRQASVAAGK